MANDDQASTTTQAERLTTVLTGLPWIEILAQAWKFGRKIMRGLADEGMYEVLEYETTLELRDRRGENALLRKREKVRSTHLDPLLQLRVQSHMIGRIHAAIVTCRMMEGHLAVLHLDRRIG